MINSLGREDSFNEEGEMDDDSEPIFVARPHFQVPGALIWGAFMAESSLVRR